MTESGDASGIQIRCLDERRAADAARLVREYMLTTEVERGVDSSAEQRLPAVLERECSRIAHCEWAPLEYFLAFHEDRLAGCVAVTPRGGDAEISRLYVRPENRRAGIARRLMGRAEAFAGELGASRLILDVLPTRHTVIEWYTRLGFSEIAPYEDLPMPMIFLAKKIDL